MPEEIESLTAFHKDPNFRMMSKKDQDKFSAIHKKHRDPDKLSGVEQRVKDIRKDLTAEDVMGMMIKQTKMQSFDNDTNTTESMMNGMLTMAQMRSIEKASKDREMQNQFEKQKTAISFLGKSVDATVTDPVTGKLVSISGVVSKIYTDKGVTHLSFSSGESCTFDEINGCNDSHVSEFDHSMRSISEYDSAMRTLGLAVNAERFDPASRSMKPIQGIAQEVLKTPKGVQILLDNGQLCNYNEIVRCHFPPQRTT